MDRDWQSWLDAQSQGVTRRGGEEYLTFETALRAMDWIEASGAVVLGIEGFWLEPRATRPSENHIADYSELAGTSDGSSVSVAAARRLLQAWSADIDAVVLVVDSGDIPGR
jgi:hypothetical protein